MPSRDRGRPPNQRDAPKMGIKKEPGADPMRRANAAVNPARVTARNTTSARNRRLETVGASSSKEMEQPSAGTLGLGQESGGGGMTFDIAGRLVAELASTIATASDESRSGIPEGTNGAVAANEAGLLSNGVDGSGRGNRRESSVHLSPLRMSKFIRRPSSSQGGVINSSQTSLLSPTPSRQRSSQMQAEADAATPGALTEIFRDAFGSPTRHPGKEGDEAVKKKKKKKGEKEKTRDVHAQKQKNRDVWADNRALSLTPSPSRDARPSDAVRMNEPGEEELEEEAMEADENVSAGGDGKGAPVAPSSPADNSSRGPSLFNEEDSNLEENSPFEDQEGEDDDELDEEEEFDEEEEERVGAARSQTAAFKKVITVRGAAIRKDRGDATDAQVRVVEKVIDDAMASSCVLCEVPIDEVRIEDDSEIDKDTVRSIVEKIKKGKMLMECATMIGWRDGGHVYLIDGRHCFTAYKAVVEEAISVRKADLSKRQYTVTDYKVSIIIPPHFAHRERSLLFFSLLFPPSFARSKRDMAPGQVSGPIVSTPHRPAIPTGYTPKIDKCIASIENCVTRGEKAIGEVWQELKDMKKREHQRTLEMNLMKSDNVTLRSENVELKQMIGQLRDDLNALKASQVTTNSNVSIEGKVSAQVSHLDPPPNQSESVKNEREMTEEKVLELVERVERNRAVVMYGIPEFPELQAAARDASDWSAVASILSFLDVSGKPTHVFRMGEGLRAGPRNGRLLKVILPSSRIQQLVLARRHQLASFNGPPGVRVWLRASLSKADRQVSQDRPFTYGPPPPRAFRKNKRPNPNHYSQYKAQDFSMGNSLLPLDKTQPNSPVTPMQYGRPPSPSLFTGLQASPANHPITYFHHF